MSAAPLVTRFRLNAGPALAVIEEMSAALPQLSERSPEAINGLIDLMKTGAQLFTVGLDGASANTNELTLVAHPSDCLLRLVAALRAGDFNLAVVEQAVGHGSHPSVGVSDAPTVTESSPVQKIGEDEGPQNLGDIT